MSEFLSKDVHDEFARRMEDEHSRISRRLESVEKAVESNKELTVAVEKLANTMDYMGKEQKRQGDRLEHLEQIPAKRWESLVGIAMSAVGGGILGYIINALF